MSQITVSATFTSGSASVVVTGEDLRPTVLAGYLIGVSGEPFYTVADVSFAAGNSTVALTAPYAGSGGNKAALIVTDYTIPDSLPLLRSGDVNTAAVFSEAMRKIQNVITYGSGATPGSISVIHFGSTPPNNDKILWWDTESGNLRVLYNDGDTTQWVDAMNFSNVAGGSGGGSAGGVTAQAITDALGYTPWGPSNDGAGTGLDADLLDGLDSSYFTNASNLATGTVPVARLGGGTPDATKVLFGDGSWRSVSTASIGYTPVNVAGDTMQGDLAFASGKRIIHSDEYGTKWLLKGSNALINFDATLTSWDFYRGSGVTRWRFIDADGPDLSIENRGAIFGRNGMTVRSGAQGQLDVFGGIGIGALLRLQSRNENGGVDTESLNIAATPTAMQIVTAATGAGGTRSLLVGTTGATDLGFVTSNINRWLVDAGGMLKPFLDGAYDVGTDEMRPRRIHFANYLVAPLASSPVISPNPEDIDGETGLAFPNSNTIDLQVNAVSALKLQSWGAHLEAGVLRFKDVHTRLTWEGQGLLSLKGYDDATAIPQTAGGLQIYQNWNLPDSGGGYRRANLKWLDSSTFQVGGENAFDPDNVNAAPTLLLDAGTIKIHTGFVDRWIWDGAGSFYPATDNATDIGTTSHRPRDLHLGRDLYLDGKQYVLGKKFLELSSTHPDWGLFNPLLLALRDGKKLYQDEDFATTDNGVTLYDPETSGLAFTRDLEPVYNPPNGSGYALTFTHTALDCGFTHDITPKPNGVFVQTFVASLPTGYAFEAVAPDMGGVTPATGTYYWASDNVGTNKYEIYTVVWLYATDGTPTNAGTIKVVDDPAVEGTADPAVTWVMAAATVFDATDRFATSGSSDADTLDGNDSAFYLDASNLNAGTLDPARLPAIPVSELDTGSAAATEFLKGDKTFGRQLPRQSVLTYNGSLTLDLNTYDSYDITMDGPLTLDISGGTDMQVMRARIRPNGHPLTLGSSIKLSADIPFLAISSASSAYDYLAFSRNDVDDCYDFLSFNRGYLS